MHHKINQRKANFILNRFLADLMDTPELVRNIAICGHLHHGKVYIFIIYLHVFSRTFSLNRLHFVMH